MIVKFLDTSTLENNPLLEFFYDGVNIDTGEMRTNAKNGNKILPYKKAYYKNLEFKIYNNNSIYVSGSLHKYFNDGLHNYNTFDFNAFLAVINDLKAKFDIEPENCIIKNLEVGLNIIPPTKTSSILDYCFLHKTNILVNSINSTEGYYKQSKHSQYLVKLYDKSLQYRKTFSEIDTEILRFELKFLKMKRVNDLGIFTLNDIIKSGFKIFENDIITEWNNILFFDNSIVNKSARMVNYKNPLYWHELLKMKSKSNFYKHKNILKKYTIQNSNKIQYKIALLLQLKIDELN